MIIIISEVAVPPMSKDDSLKVSPQTLKLVKHYAPLMGVALPLDEESFFRIYQNFYGQEVSYAMEAEEVKNRRGEWMPIERISCMFADAADELSLLDEDDDLDYGLLSRLIEEVGFDSEESYPEYRQWYNEDGSPTDFRFDYTRGANLGPIGVLLWFLGVVSRSIPHFSIIV
jgi:hypothetical protein